jgi:hypothetical protein
MSIVFLVPAMFPLLLVGAGISIGKGNLLCASKTRVRLDTLVPISIRGRRLDILLRFSAKPS